MLDNFFYTTRVGVACTSYLYAFLQEQMDMFDYIEVPFELLNHDPTVISKLSGKPLVLHCASLSLGGYTEPAESTVDKISSFIHSTQTPWLGEHLSFILAEKLDDQFYEQYAPGEPYNIGYTVAPVMNNASARHIIKNVSNWTSRLNIPIILENSPLYFTAPGSNMDQIDFINLICRESSVNLLLDLAHFYITAKNFGYDPVKALDRFPFDRVKELHISGVNLDTDMYWDNHAEKAPDIIFDMLEIVLKNCRPAAITLEYNWSTNLPWPVLRNEINRTKDVLYKCAVV